MDSEFLCFWTHCRVKALSGAYLVERRSLASAPRMGPVASSRSGAPPLRGAAPPSSPGAAGAPTADDTMVDKARGFFAITLVRFA